VSAWFATLLFWPQTLLAQAPDGAASTQGFVPPPYWYLLIASFSLLMPAGFVLISVAGLEQARAWDAALGGLAAVGLAALGYWAFGFALQFGGVGLVYTRPELSALVWEWSPFAADWGAGWGVAGLTGWFLSGGAVSSLTYSLFLAHVPWAITTALLPILALRGRAPSTATMFLALVIGGGIYPVADNWVRGGGWLAGLGNNLNLGHGFVDFAGAGTVHLVAAGLALAALVVWAPRRQRRRLQDLTLPPAQMPLLAVVGSLLILTGSLGWLWANPLQLSTLDELALMRGSVNMILFAGGGVVIPLVYTWFVTGRSEPMLSARGLAAGVVAGLAIGPFIQPGPAFMVGLLAGAAVPFTHYLADGLLRLDDATGALSVSGLPAMIGLLMLGVLADGVTGRGWQMTGVESYLGVTGQGVTGLFAAQGFQSDFPAQLQAQVIGMLTLALWGFVVGMLICAPLGVLLHSLLRSTAAPQEAHLDFDPAGNPLGAPAAPARATQPAREFTGVGVRRPED
jgi:Amt family ammonium transporter